MERVVDELGRIVLPLEIRRKYGIEPNEKLEVSEVPAGILLTKIKKTCIFCHADSDLIKIGEHGSQCICAECIRKLKDAEIGGTVNLDR